MNYAYPRTLVLVTWVLSIACTPPSSYFGTTQPRHPADELWINNSGEPEWIDPGKCSDSTGGEVISNLFAGLAEPHPETLVPQPELATHWDVAPDGRTYTFHMRPSTWSDGTPLTAEDFAYSWRRVLDPNTASRYGSIMHVIKNAQAFNERALWVPCGHDPNAVRALFAAHVPVDQVSAATNPNGVFVYLGGTEGDKPKHLQAALSLDGTSLNGVPLRVSRTPESLVGVQALDAQTLQVQLEDPVPYFLSLVAYHTFKPVPRHVLRRLEQQGLNTDLWTRPEYIVSNGAYQLTSWHFKHFFTYEKNPHYWDAAHVRINKVKVFEVESVNTALNLYRDGDLDWIGANTALPSEFLTSLQRYKDTHRDPMLSVYFYWLNTQEPPLDNVLLRRALSLAIDRAALVKYIARGGQIPTADLVPDGLAGYRGLHRPLFDPDKARNLLTQSGYTPSPDAKPVTLIYNTSEGHKQVAEAVQEMWHKNLGLDVQIENQEWKVFLKNVELHNFHIARMGWVGDYPDPTTFLHDVMSLHAGNNQSGWHDPAYEALLTHANQTVDKEARLDLLRQAEALAMEAQPMIPLYVYTRSYVRKPYVRGFWPNYQDHHPIKHMWIDERFYDGKEHDELAEPSPKGM